VSDPIYFTGPEALRAWLEAHHETETELFVGYWKKHTGKPSLTWSQAVDEALCFGWIDGRLNSVDGERHIQRFTPRKPASNWSAVNIAKVEQLRGEGRMRAAGEAAFARRRPERSGVYSYEQRHEAKLEPAQQARFEADAAAWAWFRAQSASYRAIATWWVVSAKRPETRERRLDTLIADSAAEQKIKSQRPVTPKR
jgi:uncharacterized protein YdeI (YjbR/CyaY-like superfamily)